MSSQPSSLYDFDIREYLLYDLIFLVDLEGVLFSVSLRDMNKNKLKENKIFYDSYVFFKKNRFVYPQTKPTSKLQKLATDNPYIKIKKNYLTNSFIDTSGLFEALNNFFIQITNSQINLTYDFEKTLTDINKNIMITDYVVKSFNRNYATEEKKVYLLRDLIKLKTEDLSKVGYNSYEGYLYEKYLSERKKDPQTFIYPTDLKTVSEYFFRIHRISNYSVTALMSGSNFPLVFDKNVFSNILSQDGSIKINQGDLCFDIVQKFFTDRDIEFDFQRNRLKRKKEGIELISNIDLSEKEKNAKITEVNYKEFPKKGFFSTSTRRNCFPSNFNKKDNVIGYLKDGVYVSYYKNFIETVFDNERKVFMKNFDGYDSKKIGIFENIKKNFKYPRSVENLLVTRKKPIKELYDLEEKESDVETFIEGFYNTLRLSDNTLSEDLRLELNNYIKDNYRNKISSYSERKIMKLLILRESFDTFSKKDIEKFISKITDEVEPSQAVIKLLNSPNLNKYKYPLLLTISFYVLCEENDNCNLLSYDSNNTIKTEIFGKKVEFNLDGNYYTYYN